MYFYSYKSYYTLNHYLKGIKIFSTFCSFQRKRTFESAGIVIELNTTLWFLIHNRQNKSTIFIDICSKYTAYCLNSSVNLLFKQFTICYLLSLKITITLFLSKAISKFELLFYEVFYFMYCQFFSLAWFRFSPGVNFRSRQDFRLCWHLSILAKSKFQFLLTYKNFRVFCTCVKFTIFNYKN